MFLVNMYRHVDKGGNPELYTQRCLQESLEKCSDMKAKQKAYKVCVIVIVLIVTVVHLSSVCRL